MPAPPIPQFDKKSFPDAPWLGKFFDALRPFFESASAALGSQLAPVVIARDIQVGTDESGDPVTPVFCAWRPPATVLVLVSAVELDAAGRETGRVTTPTVVWARGERAGTAGLEITSLDGLASSSRYRLTVWALPG
jgi:hypothetical protein